MSMYRVAVIEFPGTNCERETAQAVRRCGMEPEIFRWNRPARELDAFNAFIIPGGFSYEDRSRSGIIAALDTLIDGLKKQNASGKPVLGICNGAQILVESGIVPGLPGWQIGAALAENKQMVGDTVVGTGFYNNWVTIKHTATPASRPNAFGCTWEKDGRMRIPAAHAEGRFVVDADILSWMEEAGVCMFRYCDEAGTVSPHFPVNPNGAVSNLAALGNLAGTALAIMPHPERVTEGDAIFQSLKTWLQNTASYRTETPVPPAHLEEKLTGAIHAADLKPVPRTEKVHSRELVIGTVITDNAAVSVEQALARAGIPVKINRAVRWIVEAPLSVPEKDFEKMVEKAMASGQLYNSNKEFPISFDIPGDNGMAVVVQPREGEDFTGLHTIRALSSWFGISGFSRISHSIIWSIEAPETSSDAALDLIEKALASHIFANPYSQRIYRYV